jgi:hypothetical protein
MELTPEQKMIIILDELKKTLFIDPVTHGDPKPASDIKTWFKRVDDADTATNAPIKRVDLFIINLFHRIPDDFALGKDELLAGKKFKTPRDILKRIEA